MHKNNIIDIAIKYIIIVAIKLVAVYNAVMTCNIPPVLLQHESCARLNQPIRFLNASDEGGADQCCRDAPYFADAHAHLAIASAHAQ